MLQNLHVCHERACVHILGKVWGALARQMGAPSGPPTGQVNEVRPVLGYLFAGPAHPLLLPPPDHLRAAQ